MWIELIKPEFIEEKCPLPSRLRAEGLARGWSEAKCDAFLATIPVQLAGCECFLDKLTGLWRYEFGEPHRVGSEFIWGTHMWPPVSALFDALSCARLRLPQSKLNAYLALVAGDPRKHQEYLAEMFPLLRVDPAISAEHEVTGQGIGSTTIDWAIGPHDNRLVLMDVKRRFIDFIAQMDNTPATTGDAAAPTHDPALLFRSVEKKLRPIEPDKVLQGVWIVTDIKQEAAELAAAFENLNSAKVHFAFLGDHQADAHLLTRRPSDRSYLLKLFGSCESTRFTFSRTS
jgi:hypothetical protein